MPSEDACFFAEDVHRHIVSVESLVKIGVQAVDVDQSFVHQFCRILLLHIGCIVLAF